MERRGFLTWAAVGLVAVVALFALADTLRDAGRSTRSSARPAVDTDTTALSGTNTVPDPLLEAPPGWQRGVLQGVLTFTDAGDCSIRTIGLSGGREQPVPPFETACEGFWAPPVGSRLAFVSPFENGGTIRIVDLNGVRDDLGTYIASGDVQWSADGRRAAWCADPRSGIGIEWQIAGGAREIPFCPAAFTPTGELARAQRGRLEAPAQQRGRLIVGNRIVAQMPDPILYARFGPEGAVATVDIRGRVYRFGNNPVRVGPVVGWNGLRPVFSSDLCLAAFPRLLGFTVVELGCDGEVAYHRVPGTSAAWSPDGYWLAIALPGEIQFLALRPTAPTPPLVWPARALALAWRPS